MRTLTVGQLVYQIKAFVESKIHLENVLITGELSNIRQVNGHYYFNLKDAQGQISCNMWRSAASRLSFTPKEGNQVEVTGHLGIYEKRGDLRLNVDTMKMAGVGALFEELERRKKMLAEMGYFNADHKKTRPAEIATIGIVTGPSTAALQDMLKTIRERWPWLKVYLHPASVQGDNAPKTIVKALKEADIKGYDAVLLARGGGSIEDLFCFNDPDIVKTLYNMNTYVVTGIGHEIDTTLADLAADHRAVTPTAAAQWVTLNAKDEQEKLIQLDAGLNNRMQHLLSNAQQRFLYIQSNPWLSNPASWILSKQNQLSSLSDQLLRQAGRISDEMEEMLDLKTKNLISAADAAMKAPVSRLNSYNEKLLLNSPKGKILSLKSDVSHLEDKMTGAMININQVYTSELVKLNALLRALSPASILERGYAIVSRQDQPVTSSKGLKSSQEIEITFKDGSVDAVVK